MHIPNLVKIDWHLLKLLSGNENTDVWRADNKNEENLLIYNPKPLTLDIQSVRKIWIKSIKNYSS